MLEARDVQRERTVVAARWLVLTAILVFAQLAHPAETPPATLYALVAGGAAYNMVYRTLLRRRFLPPFLSELTILAETLLCSCAVIVTGGPSSTLVPLLAWPVVAAAFLLGATGAVAAALLTSLTSAAIFLVSAGEVKLDLSVPVATLAFYLLLTALLCSALFNRAGGWIGEDAAADNQSETDRGRRVTRTQTQAMAAVSSVLTGTLNYERVLETILGECSRLLPFDSGIVFLFDPGGSELHIAADRGLTASERQIRLDPATGGLGRAVRQGDPVIIADPSADESLRRFSSLANARAGVCVPLHAGFEMFGAIVLTREKGGTFTQAEIDLLLAFSNQAVLAMHNARLYDSLRKERYRVVENDEDARRRLARDLHDGPVQLVAAMAMKSEVIKRMAGDPERLAEELNGLAEMSHRASRDLRTVLFELRPIMLESHGLVATLKEYVQKMRDTHGAPLRLDPGGFARRLPPMAESTVFAIVQEAVNNALKHAAAKNIWIRLGESSGFLLVAVEDDGRGFDVAAVEGSYNRRGSLGLLNMQERAELIDGILTVLSTPGTGTTLTLRVPISEAPANREAASAGTSR